MMLLLGCDVSAHRFDLRKTNRENAVTVLPGKILQVSGSIFDPEGGSAFYFLDHFCGLASTGEGREDMHVIFDASNEDWLAVMAQKNAADVTVEFFAQIPIAQKRATLFG